MFALDNNPGDTAGNGNPGNGEITAAEGEAYRLLVIDLPAPLPTWAGPKDRLLACITGYTIRSGLQITHRETGDRDRDHPPTTAY